MVGRIVGSGLRVVERIGQADLWSIVGGGGGWVSVRPRQVRLQDRGMSGLRIGVIGEGDGAWMVSYRGSLVRSLR